VFNAAWAWYEELLMSERLLIHDTSELSGDVNLLESRAAELRKRYPTRSIVVYADNFHLYENSASSREKDGFVRELSKRFKNMANALHVSVMATMELPKNALAPGMRPRLHNIKGSAKVRPGFRMIPMPTLVSITI
jgi:replicative DNA helicase